MRIGVQVCEQVRNHKVAEIYHAGNAAAPLHFGVVHYVVPAMPRL